MCVVVVEDLPKVALGSGDYVLNVSGQGKKPLPANGKVEVVIDRKISVGLQGDKYKGSVMLDPEDCRLKVDSVIHAKPKAAKLAFLAAIPLSQISVSCLAGCTEQDKLAGRFPLLEFEGGETERQIELEFKAKGYRSWKDDFTIYPGQNNPIRINLLKIGNGD